MIIDNMDPRIARRIINSLKSGVPSENDVLYYSPLVHPLDNVIDEDLEEISDGFYTIVKFLNGSYGEGKTHFLSRVRARALEDNFVVSIFEIAPRGVTFDMMERVVAELVKKITVKGYSHEDSSQSTLDYIVSSWCRKNRHPELELRNMGLEKDVQSALISLSHYLQNPNLYQNEIEQINSWFLGESISARVRRQLGIGNLLTASNAHDVLESLSIFFQKIGYKGWILLIDEAEVISTLLTTRKRERTEHNIRHIIDQQGERKGYYILFATTEEFFTDPERGIVSYPALKTRISEMNTIQLPPISKDDMCEIGVRIRRICEIAWGNPLQMTEEDIERCASAAWEKEIPSARARTYVTSFIKLMTSIRLGAVIDPASSFEEIYLLTYDDVATQKERAIGKVMNG